MEPILLYGHPQGSSLGLIAALEWLGQPYRLSRVAMPEDMLTDAYKRINGRQETPVLMVENGTALTETVAIALWLEARDHQRRISFASGTAEADRLHQYIAFINSSFTPAFSPLWAALEMNPPNPALQETFAQLRPQERCQEASPA
jgi:glutathione S-transferase